MARPTHDEIIRESTRDITILKERVDNLRAETESLAELTRQIALLQQRVEDMRRGGELWLTRLWAIVAPVAVAVVIYLLGFKK